MLIRLLSAALALAVLSASQAAAQEPAAAVAITTPQGLRVAYRLPAPVRSVSFADRAINREMWSPSTPGLTLSDGVISGAQPFDAFDLDIAADTAERDRVYMALSRIGDGVVVYGPGLKLEGHDLDLVLQTAEGQTALPDTTPEDGYAYLGSTRQVAGDARAAVAVGAGTPPELAGPLRDGFFDAMTFYGRGLARALPSPPALLISVDGPGPAQFRGDVTDTGVTSLRFHGEAWRTGMEQVATFVWHEAFHLWNGKGARDAETAPWLHEGGADYAALVGAVSSGALSEEQGRGRLARWLNGCRTALGRRAFDPARLRTGAAPYDCGALVQWLADLELRAAGRGDVMTLWRALLDAESRSGGYGVDQFRALLAPDSAALVLFDAPGPERWTAAEAQLSRLGVTLENRPGDEDLMAAALFHVAGRNCRGSYGFNNNPGELKLDGADCGVLSGQPVIVSVEDLPPQTEGRAMFAAVQARCAAGQPVRYLTADRRTLEAPCDAPLAEPNVWAVATAPALAIANTPDSARPL
ncbi:MAG TPA: hypothetical protein VFF48_07320 [Brevundimonas sp.]|nr:hypothetical protein [Brevundimonas sp.]